MPILQSPLGFGPTTVLPRKLFYSEEVLQLRFGHIMQTELLQQIRKLILLALLGAGASLQAADPFAEFVRSTGPRTPEEELKGFHVPPGFEVQLVAAEPDIGKVMN